MNLKRYQDFLKSRPINENLDKSKKFLKERELLNKAAKNLGFIDDDIQWKLKEGEKRTIMLSDFTPEQQDELKIKLRELRLSSDEIKNIERDPEFLKIRELLGQYIGWTYPFTYFYFVEMVSLDELFTNEDSIFNKLIEYKGLLDKLPKKFDQNFIDPNIPNNSEILIDGLDSLEDWRRVKKVIDKLTPTLKKDYNNAPDIIKQQFTDVARGFDELGGGDEEKKEKLWKSFFGEIRTIQDDQVIHGRTYKKGDKRYFGPLNRYKTIVEFIKAGQNYLKSSENETALEFYDKINNCNEKYGTLGADVVFEENGILIIEVKSFQANQYLNGHTRHCIKDYDSQWRNYVSSHYNKQYYIYNFNIPQYNNLSTIGITIEPGQRIRAAHDKVDASISKSIKSTLKAWEKEYNIEEDLFSQLKPMSSEEIEKREKAKLAEREIVKKGITIEQIKQYVTEDGADINKDNAKALINAVEEDDMEKVEYCLSLGASPNLAKESESAISRAKNLDMIKLLVSHGSDITNTVYKNILDKPDALEFCLKAGVDPNHDRNLPLRTACKGSWKSMNDIGESYFDSFKLLIKYGAKTINEFNRSTFLKWTAEYNRMDILKWSKENGYFDNLGVIPCGQTNRNISQYEDAIRWVGHARRMSTEDKEALVKYLESEHRDFESGMPDDWRERK